MPQCLQCGNCKRDDNNFCETLSLTNFFADMDDGTSRFTCKGQKVSHFFGTSTFSEYTVVKATMLAKIDSAAPMEKACLVGCGFTTGFGSAMNSAEIRPGDSVAVFGAGCVGLSAMHGAQNAGAKEIFAIDINPDKEKIAREMGATGFVNPKDCPEGKPFAEWYIEKFGHVDRAIECIGNIECMKNAVYITKPGWGRTVIVGLGAPGKEFSINPLVFLERKTILGSCYGDYRVQDAPKLVEKIQTGAINIDPLITHRFDLKDVNQAVELLKQGKCIRSVISLARHE
ncbi:unnamed protein product, partial [Mesorhabditis spiculigera]